MTVESPALRYHGAKFRLASWTMQFFPPHVCYTEAFGGAAGVLLQKPRCYAEVYNDLDGDIVNFFRVLRDPTTRAVLIDSCQLTPYARDEFDLAWEPTEESVERARRTAVRAAMSFGSAGSTKGRSGFRIDTRRKYGTASHVWSKYPAGLGRVGERFQGVVIEQRPATSVLIQHDAPDTLHFVDPPYLPETRDRYAIDRYYRHEMGPLDHAELLGVLKRLQGFVVLCGYPSAMYETELEGWQKHTTSARASGNRGTVLRTECVWLNPACVAALERSPGGLFAEVSA
jgi:DNA adenine methylase